MEYAGKLFPVVFRRQEPLCANRVPLFPLPIFVCFREELQGNEAPAYEHVFCLSHALVIRANQIVVLLNNLASGETALKISR